MDIRAPYFRTHLYMFALTFYDHSSWGQQTAWIRCSLCVVSPAPWPRGSKVLELCCEPPEVFQGKCCRSKSLCQELGRYRLPELHWRTVIKPKMVIRMSWERDVAYIYMYTRLYIYISIHSVWIPMALDDTCSKDSLTICKIFKTMLFMLLQHVHPSAGVWLSSWAANPLVHFTWVWEPVPQTFSDARSWEEPIPWCCVKRLFFWLNTAQDLQPLEFSENAFLETDGYAFAHGFVWN